MKTVFFIICSLLFVLFFTSCDSRIDLKGRVLDQNTRRPVEAVQVNLGKLDSTLTDADGYFIFNQRLYGSVYTQKHVLLVKSGYDKTYRFVEGNTSEIELLVAKSKKVGSLDAFSGNVIKWIYQVQMVMVYVCFLFSIAILFIKKVRYKLAWIGLMFSSYISLHISCIDGKFSHWELKYPLIVQHYWTHPYTVEMIVPIGMILFWVFVFIKNKKN